MIIIFQTGLFKALQFGHVFETKTRIEKSDQLLRSIVVKIETFSFLADQLFDAVSGPGFRSSSSNNRKPLQRNNFWIWNGFYLESKYFIDRLIKRRTVTTKEGKHTSTGSLSN